MYKRQLLSVENHELPEVVGLAKKFDDLKMPMYATADTAQAIRSLGIQVHEIPPIVPGSEAYQLMEAGKIGLIVYTGALYDDTIREYIELHREAVRHSIASITALDTANAMANMIASRFHLYNTELVDLNHMRKERQLLPFAKMQGCGNDYIFFDNRDGKVASPGSLCVSLCSWSTRTWPTPRCASSTGTAPRAAWPATPSAAWASTFTTRASSRRTT